MGQDEARKRAQEQVAHQGNTGGGNSGGDPPKHRDNYRKDMGEEESGGPK